MYQAPNATSHILINNEVKTRLKKTSPLHKISTWILKLLDFVQQIKTPTVKRITGQKIIFLTDHIPVPHRS